jgi:hypothetical protein
VKIELGGSKTSLGGQKLSLEGQKQHLEGQNPHLEGTWRALTLQVICQQLQLVIIENSQLGGDIEKGIGGKKQSVLHPC